MTSNPLRQANGEGSSLGGEASPPSSCRSIVGAERRPEVDLSVGGEELVELLGRRSRRVGRREGRRGRRHRAVTNESLETRRCAQDEHSRRVAVDPKRVRNPHRHDSDRPFSELEPLTSGHYGQAPVQNNVALVLRMRVERRGGVPREEELDHSQASVGRLAADSDGRECSQEPQSLPLSRPGEGRTQGLGCGRSRRDRSRISVRAADGSPVPPGIIQIAVRPIQLSRS